MRPWRLVSLLMMLAVAGLALHAGVHGGDVLAGTPVRGGWALLYSGRYPGEGRLLARVPRTATRRRAAARRWSRALDRVVASLLEQATLSLRGPPAASSTSP